MKTDAQLKKEVEDELDREPAIDAAHVAVAVDGGVMTLAGHLDTYAEKYEAERSVRRVGGVKAIAQEVDVRLAQGHVRTDSDLAQAISSAFRWHSQIPADQIQIRVAKGRVTLIGNVSWDYQRRMVEQTVRPIKGVVVVTNLLALQFLPTPENISAHLQKALVRQAEREARQIEVTLVGSTVTLRGHVHSRAEHNAAQGAAWSAPGVTEVINELQVVP